MDDTIDLEPTPDLNKSRDPKTEEKLPLAQRFSLKNVVASTIAPRRDDSTQDGVDFIEQQDWPQEVDENGDMVENDLNKSDNINEAAA